MLTSPKPVATATPNGDCRIPYQLFRSSKRLRAKINRAEREYMERMIAQVEERGIYLSRGEQTQASGEFVGLLRIVTAKFGGTTNLMDVAESRSHSRRKERKQLRHIRRLHPRNAALSA